MKRKKQNSDLTAVEWAEVKKQFMISVFREILKENSNLMSQFVGLVKKEILNDTEENL